MLTLKDITDGMGKLNDWLLEENSIVKQVEFPDFKKAIEYVNKVAEIAEKYAHHPDIFINYTLVRLVLTTHEAHELTEIDLKVAEEIDKIILV